MKEVYKSDSEGRQRLFVESVCAVCNAAYSRQKRHVNEYNTCSIKCTSVAKGITVVCHCDECGALFYRAKSKLNTKSGKHFCCRICKEKTQTYMDGVKPDHYGVNRSNYRTIAFRAYKPVCNRCGYSNKVALEVHHIDRDRTNNIESNLEILCCNCHTLEHRAYEEDFDPALQAAVVGSVTP